VTTQKWVATGTVRVDLAVAARITFGSMAFLAEFTDYQNADTSYLRMMSLVSADGATDRWSIDRSFNSPNYRVTLANDLGTNRFVNVNSILSSGKHLIVITKTTGTTTPRLHVWNGSAWTHTAFGGTQADCNTPRYLYLGGRFGQLGAAAWQPNWLYMAGLFNASLSDANCESLTAGARAWVTRGDCVGFWQLNRETTGALRDLSGVGSTLDTDDGTTEIDTTKTSNIPLIGSVQFRRQRAVRGAA
jgi:hypothetical protein